MTTQWVTRHGRTVEVEMLRSSEPAPKPKRRAQHRFTKIPEIWEHELGKAHVSGSTYAVAIVLLYEAWVEKSNGRQPIVKLTNKLLRPADVGEDGKQAALEKLVELKLVDVKRLPGRSPLVTVYFLD